MTLHEHLTKLVDAGFVKRKEREGHKWVYYQLSWKGESLIHPENTRVVLLFTSTFIVLFIGIVGLISATMNTVSSKSPQVLDRVISKGQKNGLDIESETQNLLFGQEPIVVYSLILCFIIVAVLLGISLWRYKKNKTPKI